jgi:cob(I)alamin adenosyltransferase
MGSGDKGATSLPHCDKVKKTDPRIHALALLDELSATLGLARARFPKKTAADLLEIQRTLLKVSAQAAGLDFSSALQADTTGLETRIKELTGRIKPEKEFVLPGDTETEALLHLARAKTRLCEISLWEINSAPAAVYLNRLSDLLFLLALISSGKTRTL